MYLLSHTWPVYYSRDLLALTGNLGVTLPVEYAIVVDATQGKDQMVNTLLHECLHAIWAVQMTPKLKHRKQEAVIRMFTPGLISLLRSNKGWW